MAQYGPVKLPSGLEVCFREPKNTDRRHLLDGFNSEEMKQAGKLEEALAYTCLEKIGDKDVRELLYTGKMDMLNIKDDQFYKTLFIDMFTIGREELQQIQQLSKKLLGGGTVES